MEYTQLLKTAWQATWRHKRMWWLGMAVIGGTGSAFFRASVDLTDLALDDTSGTTNPLTEALNSPLAELWWQDYWWIVVVAIIALFLLWLMAIIFHLIAQSGLYAGAQQARLEKPVAFGAMIQAGVKSFWRYVGFYLLLGFGKSIAQFVITINIILLALTIIGLIVAVPLAIVLMLAAIPFAMALEVFMIYSLQGMTLQHLGPVVAMQQAWQRLRCFPGHSALSYVLMLLIKVVIWLVGVLIVLLIATPFAIFAYVTYTSQAPLLAVVSGSIGLLVLTVIGLIGKGIFISFQSHFWHRVYSLPQ